MENLVSFRQICLVFFLVNSAFTISLQGSNIDSLTNLLIKTSDNFERVQLLNQLAACTYYADGKLALDYATEAKEISLKTSNYKSLTESYRHLAFTYFTFGEYENVINSAKLCINESISNGLSSFEADAYFIMGRAFIQLKQNEKAKASFIKCDSVSKSAQYLSGQSMAAKGFGDLEEINGNFENSVAYYQSELLYAEKSKDKICLATAYNDLGRVYDIHGHFGKALNYYIKGLNIAEKHKLIKIQAGLSGNIGSMFYSLKNYDKALKYATDAVTLFTQLNDMKGVGGSTTTIANILRKQNCYPEALTYYREVLEIRKNMGDDRGISYVYSNLGDIYSNMENHEKALEYKIACLKIRNELGFKLGIVGISQSIADTYLKMEEYDMALPYIKNTMQISNQIGALREIANSYNLMAKYYSSKGKFELAFQEQQKYIEAKDKYINEDSNSKLGDILTKYETEKKEKQIIAQEKDILKLENSNTKIKFQRNGIFGGTILTMIISFILFHLYRIRQDRNGKKEFADALMLAQEDERKRISRDLHDGVGQSLLLIKKQLESNDLTNMQNHTLINETLEEVRSLSRNLHPFQLEKLGLTVSILDVIDKVSESAHIFITKDIDNIDGLLPLNYGIHVYRIIQESLNNIIKHSNASASKITIKIIKDQLSFEIKDNGMGFDYELVKDKLKSLGLRTMQERISSIGGKLKVQKNKPSGTIISFSLPILV